MLHVGAWRSHTHKIVTSHLHAGNHPAAHSCEGWSNDTTEQPPLMSAVSAGPTWRLAPAAAAFRPTLLDYAHQESTDHSTVWKANMTQYPTRRRWTLSWLVNACQTLAPEASWHMTGTSQCMNTCAQHGNPSERVCQCTPTTLLTFAAPT
jgi:hypothetical protein